MNSRKILVAIFGILVLAILFSFILLKLAIVSVVFVSKLALVLLIVVAATVFLLGSKMIGKK